MVMLINGMLLGICFTFTGAYLYQAARYRLTHGKKILVAKQEVGYVISCRYNGSKHWFFIDECGQKSQDHFDKKQNATRACKKDFLSRRHKQTTIARIA